MRTRLSVLVCVLGLAACGRWHFEPTPPRDAAAEAGEGDAMIEAGTDAMIEAGMDAMIEAGMDATTDAQPDVMTATDARSDAPSDAASDAPTDAEVDSGGPARDLDFCVEIPRLRGPATIDGVLEPGLLLRTFVPQGWTSGINPLPTDQPSSYAVAWQPDGIYFYVKVVDPSRLPALPTDQPWTGDGVELFVDTDGLFPAAPAYDLDAVQYCTAAPNDDVTPVARAEGYRDAAGLGPWTSTEFRAFPTSDGYVLEAMMYASDTMLPSWAFVSGGRIGFDLAVDVSFDAVPMDIDAGEFQPRMGQYFLRVSDQPDTCNGAPYCQPLAFCTPQLID